MNNKKKRKHSEFSTNFQQQHETTFSRESEPLSGINMYREAFTYMIVFDVV